ncbi:carbohydrate ABC transporter permease [Alkalispirochaeta alkalica]|uniref:carbohydrate ABC transporter permease n=1 Tax=Alkalispirochaeta alkalica TaxID=46356 RepID=UPI00037C7686|nr:carbohydrate ABC transporter permease [Alkalispirochaeta alkalica]
MIRKATTSWKTLSYAIIAIWLLFSIAPLLWLVGASLKTPEEAAAFPPTIVNETFTLQNFGRVLQSRGFGGGGEFRPQIRVGRLSISGPSLPPGIRPFWNSISLAATTTFFSLAISTMAGYVLALYRFPLRGFMRVFVLLSQQIPIILMIVPLFLVLATYRLAFTFTGLNLALIVFVTPFSTWLMMGFFAVMPVSILESARIDGAGDLKIFLRIMLPLATPGIATAAIFAFTRAWNEFMIVLALSRGQDSLPYTVGLFNFFGEYGSGSWHLIAAAALLASLPVLVLFTVFQKYFISGMTSGAVKQ